MVAAGWNHLQAAKSVTWQTTTEHHTSGYPDQPPGYQDSLKLNTTCASLSQAKSSTFIPNGLSA